MMGDLFRVPDGNSNPLFSPPPFVEDREVVSSTEERRGIVDPVLQTVVRWSFLFVDVRSSPSVLFA